MEVTPAEPVELLEMLRRLAAVDPAGTRAWLPAAVTAAISVGVPASRVRDVEVACESYARELWLWLVGERTWAQCSAGLCGRIARRRVA